MEPKNSSFSLQSTFVVVLAIVALLVTVVAVVPSLRQPVRDFFTPEQRIILAKVSGDITGKGLKVSILKIQYRDSLVLEIYNEENPEQSVFMGKITLPERRDAYFQLRGNATNLGLSDVDGDSTLEILAPAFDDQMVARLNIYKFNSATRSFERINSPPNGEF
jgi:hypothetical protein